MFLVSAQGAIIAVGITVGFIVFVTIFMGIGLLDIYRKKKAEQDLNKKMKEAKLREKQKKLGAMITGGGAEVTTGAPSRPATAKKTN